MSRFSYLSGFSVSFGKLVAAILSLDISVCETDPIPSAVTTVLKSPSLPSCQPPTAQLFKVKLFL